MGCRLYVRLFFTFYKFNYMSSVTKLIYHSNNCYLFIYIFWNSIQLFFFFFSSAQLCVLSQCCHQEYYFYFFQLIYRQREWKRNEITISRLAFFAMLTLTNMSCGKRWHLLLEIILFFFCLSLIASFLLLKIKILFMLQH